LSPIRKETNFFEFTTKNCGVDLIFGTNFSRISIRARQQYLKLSEREKREQKARRRLIVNSQSNKLFKNFIDIQYQERWQSKHISPAASLVLWQKRVPFGTWITRKWNGVSKR